MVHVVATNEKTGNTCEFNFKSIVSIDGVPYVSSNQELRDAVIDLQARLSQLERMLVVVQPEMSQGQQE